MQYYYLSYVIFLFLQVCIYYNKSNNFYTYIQGTDIQLLFSICTG